MLSRGRMARLGSEKAQKDARSTDSTDLGAVCQHALLKRVRWDALQWWRMGVRVSRDIAMRMAAGEGQVATALTSLNALVYTRRSKPSKHGRRRFWVEMCEAAKRQPFLSLHPPWLRVALQSSGLLGTDRPGCIWQKSRSSMTAKVMLQHAITDAVRLVQRCLGPAEKAGEIRPDILNSFWSIARRNSTKGRPWEPAAGLHACGFVATFLLRETELPCPYARHGVRDTCWVALYLLASKKGPRDQTSDTCTFFDTVRRGCPSCPYCSAVVLVGPGGARKVERGKEFP